MWRRVIVLHQPKITEYQNKLNTKPYKQKVLHQPKITEYQNGETDWRNNPVVLHQPKIGGLYN